MERAEAPSGRSVKVTSCLLVWGAEHDERFPSNDCFALEFVYTDPDANDEAHEQEAKEVFELIRPVSEQWGFATATVAAFSTIERGRWYDLFIFERNGCPSERSVGNDEGRRNDRMAKDRRNPGEEGD